MDNKGHQGHDLATLQEQQFQRQATGVIVVPVPSELRDQPSRIYPELALAQKQARKQKALRAKKARRAHRG